MLGNDYHLTSNMFSFPALHSPHYAGAGDLMDITCSTLLHPSETEDRFCLRMGKLQHRKFMYTRWHKGSIPIIPIVFGKRHVRMAVN